MRKVVDAVSLLLVNELDDYRIVFDTDKSRLSIVLRKYIFGRLATFVTTHAMQKILIQVDRFLGKKKKN